MGNHVSIHVVALDLLNPLIDVVFKMVDYAFEFEWKPFYHHIISNDWVNDNTKSHMIMVNSIEGKTNIVVSHCLTKVQLEDVTNTLYAKMLMFQELVMSIAFYFRKLRLFKIIMYEATTTTTIRCDARINHATTRYWFDLSI